MTRRSDAREPGRTPGDGASRHREPGDAPAAPSHDVFGDPSADLYRLLVDSVLDYAIFALDERGYVRTWNAGAERLNGYEAHEIIGKHFSVFYPRNLIAEGFPAFELRTAENVGRFEDEGWRVRKDGSRYWANVVITPLRDTGGTLSGFAKVTRDLTDRRDAEQTLRKSEESFRLLVGAVRDYAIFMLDPQGHVETWNAGAQRIKGYRADEIIGQSFEKFYPPEDIAAGKPARELRIAIETGKYEEEGWRLRQDGTAFWASVLITAVRNRAGELVGFAKVTRDLTERRRAEERTLAAARIAAVQEAARAGAETRERELRDVAAQLQRQAAALEQRGREAKDAQRQADDANRAKSQFLASMSHELRTPLNAIGGYADLLMMGLSGPVTPQQTEQLGRIKRGQEYLLGIINDILNFSRIEAGQLTYDIGPMLVNQALEGVLHLVTPQLLSKNLHIGSMACPPDLVAWADKSKVEQILLNLISNAVKFTAPGGSVSVSCEQLPDHRVAIRVQDTGSGIAPEYLRSIFEPFVQVGRSLTSTPQGTGLGLAISRDLAVAMGGDLTVESTVSVGSTFTLTLPREPHAEPLRK